VARAYHDVNMMFGDIVKVTPSSKVVGDMALMMVSQDSRSPTSRTRTRTSPSRNPSSSMMRGDLGQPPGGWPEGDPEEGAEGREALYGSSGLASAAGRSRSEAPEIEESWSARTSIRRFASYLMYPKVFSTSRRAGRCTARLAAADPVYFYGLEQDEEIFADLEPARRWSSGCLAVGDTDEKGMVTVFFELNGQPRRIKVARPCAWRKRFGGAPQGRGG
jgi:pyruvate carboxylase